uniref:Uncharacterized protein n=1 Tax=Ditylenchus dipsaci TaxID=166011 RepID=A0A915DI26_9BILA
MIAILSERNVVDITATAATFNFPDKLVVSYAYELPLLKGHCIAQLQLMSKDYVVVFFKAAKEHPEYQALILNSIANSVTCLFKLCNLLLCEEG